VPRSSIGEKVGMDEDYQSRLRRMKDQLDQNEIPTPDDIRYLVEHCQRTDTKLLEVVDLLRQSRNAFRSKQIERARKILEELL
jgi:hypothetical protein